MAISTGEMRVRAIARSKKLRAALAFRRGHRKTSNLAELVDGPEQVAPAPSDFDVGLIDVPAIAYRVLTGSGGLGELWREPLDPPVDAHVIDLDASLRQEFLHIPVGEAEPEVPPDSQGDDLGREAVPGEG